MLSRYHVCYMNTEDKSLKDDIFTVDHRELKADTRTFTVLAAGYESTHIDNIEIHGWEKVMDL
jgi:hypothetical protein